VVRVHPVRAAALALAGAVLVAGVGCSGTEGELTPGEKNLQTLSVMWGRYIQRNRGQSPPNEAEFKKFVKGMSKEELSGMGVDPNDIDKLFTSPRDNQPYGFAYRTPASTPGADGTMPMVIWEQTGVNGKRMVANSLGKIEEIDEAEFSKRSSARPKGK
jgi:hypothetical protein